MADKKPIRYAMSRRKWRMILLFVLFVVLPVLSVLDHRAGEDIRRDYLQQDQRSKDMRKYHNKTFRVIKILDGDTLILDVKDSLIDYTRVRLLGIDTPEIGNLFPMHYGYEARRAAGVLAYKRQVVVKLDDVADVRDRYGRLLAYIVLTDYSLLYRNRNKSDPKILNELLLQRGFGYADTRFEHSQYEKYILLQCEAMEKDRGLWEEVTFDQLPRWLQRESPNLLNNQN